MAYVQGLIDAAYSGSFEQAALAVIPKLECYGHGKGLASALLNAASLDMAAVDRISDKLTGAVRAGFIAGFSTNALRRVNERANPRLEPQGSVRRF